MDGADAEDMATCVTTKAKALTWLISEIECESDELERAVRSDTALSPAYPFVDLHVSHVQNVTTAMYALVDDIIATTGLRGA